MSMQVNETTLQLGKAEIPTSPSIANELRKTADPKLAFYMDEAQNGTHADQAVINKIAALWDKTIEMKFQGIVHGNDADIPAGLHDLALDIDEALTKSSPSSS
ncbi:hypothetical protein [Cohnella yongneupensis]|uniref:Uncharacterized protein n=1 Tax=Cohnella yongneupensis TaxID=425006 RepID=A0ABW0R3Y9_9BACL